MNINRDPEVVMAAWLDDGPAQLPTDTRQAIAVGIRSVPRRRPGFSWPFGNDRPLRPTLDLQRLAVAIGAVAVIAVAALALNFSALPGVGGLPTQSPTASATNPAAATQPPNASPSLSPASPIPSLETTPSASPTDPSTSLPSPRPSPAVGSSRFTSSIHGISIDYPSGWQIREATEPWNHDAVAFGSPEVDVIFDPTLQDELYIGLVSEPLGGMSADEWCCGPVVAATEVCNGPNGYIGGAAGRWTVDGVRGWIQSCGDRTYLVAVTTATHGYVIYLHVADERLYEATYGDPWDWFEAFLETVDLLR